MLTQTAWCLALIAVVSLAGQVVAQAPDLRMLSLRSLKAGRSIRVGGRDFGTLTGSFAGVRDGSLWLGAEAAKANVPIAGIDSVWVGRGHSTTGAIVGGVVGILPATAAISGRHCTFEYEDCLTEGYAKFMVVWLGSAIVGAIIGDQINSWDLRYP